MDKIKRIWNGISYEVLIFTVIVFQFLVGRSLDLDKWSSAWQAMDYSMGIGTRLFIGSIYRLFYGEWLDLTVAYKYVAAGIILTAFVLAIVLGKLIRMTIKEYPIYKNVIYGTVAAYMAAPFSIAYVWNEQNLGRLDVYMLLVALLCVLTALTIENFYMKTVLITILGVIGLAIHQGFAFLYYPLAFTVLCYDAFAENRVHVKKLVGVVISGAIEVAVSVFFQFFSGINFDSVEETVEYIQSRTNLVVSDMAIELEYFGSIKHQLELVTSVFWHGNEDPLGHMLLIVLTLSPILVLYILVWKDVFAHLKAKKVKLLCSPYLYALLVNLCFVPMFVIHSDWGRHFAPLMAMPTFVFLFFLAKKDEAMVYAYGKMEARIKKYPWYFVITLIWIMSFDSFGAREFQNQIAQLHDFFTYGFYIN